MSSEHLQEDEDGQISPVAPTMADGTSAEATPAEGVHSSLSRTGTRGAVALLEGTGAQLSGETNALLRRRLRAAALLVCIGMAIALVPRTIRTDYFSTPAVSILIFHVGMVIVLGLVAFGLYRHATDSLGVLRAIELTVFGLPIVFFLVSEFHLTQTCCEAGHFEFFAGRWLVLMYTYALFIPNTWQRAAVVLGIMALVPVLMLLGMILINPMLAGLIAWDDWTRIVLVNLLACGSGVYGVYMIGSLRQEVFEARQVGQYRLRQRIGVGGMGEVFLAEHQMMKRTCVVKLIRAERAGDPRSLARFQREVRATAKLSHWNTVDVFDYGSTEDGSFFYVMEYLPGMSLAELVRRHGPMPPARVIHFLSQACDALNEAHAAGLIHRDIKPANIFAAYRGGIHDVAKLLDFGLVKSPTDERWSAQLTVDGTITGSPLFMSPEQAVAESEPDRRSDVYSLGAVGYYLLTGKPPFEGDKPLKVMFAHAHNKLAPPSSRGIDVPDDLERVILRCLEKRPADRFQSAAALAAALSACRDADGWTRAEAAAWWQNRKEAPATI